MSLEKMNDKMMREYLRDHRIDIGKPEYEEGSLFGKFTLFFRDETFNFRDSHSLSDLYENCIVSAAYSGTGPHYAITCVHGSRSNYDGMYSQMEEAQKLFLSVFRVDQRQYYQNQSMPENSFISFIFVILDGGIIPLQYLYRYIIRINSSIQKGPPGFPESPLHSFTLLKEYGEGVDRMCRELEGQTGRQAVFFHDHCQRCNGGRGRSRVFSGGKRSAYGTGGDHRGKRGLLWCVRFVRIPHDAVPALPGVRRQGTAPDCV